MKKLLLLFLALLPIAASAYNTGSCGEDVTYTFLEESGTLTISGTGAMTDYTESSSVPWYSYRGKIKKAIITEGVTSIGNRVFYYCSGLTSVTIPNSVISIGTAAFSQCSGLTSVTIPNSVTSIGNGAFSFCSNLTSVTIPNSVISIGDDAFKYCRGLTSVTIPNSVTTIGTQAFSNCSGLTSISVESDNTAYDSRENCNAIIETSTNTLTVGCKNTIIPNSVTSIGHDAFFGCSGLTSMTIPNSVTSIGYLAFCGCTGLTSLTIGNSVTSIGQSAFSGCTGLTSLTIGNNVTYIEDYAFEDCSGLISVTCMAEKVPTTNGFAFKNSNIGNATLYVPAASLNAYMNKSPWNEFGDIDIITKFDYSGSCGDNVNFSFEEATGTLTISGAGAMSDYTQSSPWYLYRDSINTVILIDGVTSIGDYAFYNCSSITSVTIPNSVTSIGNLAFTHCSGLTSVTIPNSVTSIGNNAFADCSGLTSVIIPNSVTSIDSYAFAYCSGLTYVTIGNNVTSIGEWGFASCSSLISVTIGTSVTSIANSAFFRCSGLTTVHISDLAAWCKISFGASEANPLSYAHHLYMNGEEIKDLVIPNVVTSISQSAFNRCTGLTSVTIPNSVISISNYAFSGCTGLTSVTIPNSVTSIGYNAFSGCSGLTEVNFNATNCASMGAMGSVYFPVFDRCTSIRTINIGENVKNIPAYAFATCSGLTSVISEIENPFEIEENVFCTDPSIYSTATLTVPHGTKEAYQATSAWNLFEHIEEAMGIDPTDGDGGTDYGDDSEINNDTNLDGNVVGNIYYNIGNDDGGYSSAEGCIVINTPSADDNIDGKDIFGEDFKDHFTGIVFKIGAGSGTIKVKAETVGSMVLKVKIGDSAPMVMVLNGKLEASFPYNVSEPTLVYIYGGESASDAPGHRSSGDNALKIYGISWEEEGTSIGGLTPNPSPIREGNWYTLDGRKLQGKPTQKGVYVRNGAKVVIK